MTGLRSYFMEKKGSRAVERFRIEEQMDDEARVATLAVGKDALKRQTDAEVRGISRSQSCSHAMNYL